MRRIVVVGASLAGLRAAEALRRLGHDGPLTLVGAEPHEPYDRPPLSKSVLTGAVSPEETRLRQHGDLDAEWVLGDPVTRLDPSARLVHLASSRSLPYDGLVAATGASARRLASVPEDLPGVHLLRTLDDAVRLREALAAGPRVVVIGGGFIGMEVASTCRETGLDVTVVSPDPILGRALGGLSGAAAARAVEHGVRLRCPAGISGVLGTGRVEAVVLTDGERLPADLALVAIGAGPEAGWTTGLGLDTAAGLACDEELAVRGLDDVVAAGDVARWPHPGLGLGPVRLEHWSNAGEQAAAAAKRLLHGPGVGPHAAVPSFWSDQFGVRLQGVGLPLPTDEVVVLEGDPAGGHFVAEYRRSGQLVAAVVAGSPRALLPYRRQLGTPAPALRTA